MTFSVCDPALFFTYNSGGEVAIGFDKGNHFGPAFGCCDHEYIFGITEDGVIEQDAKEHDCQRNQLSSFIGRGYNRGNLVCHCVVVVVIGVVVVEDCVHSRGK